MRILPARTRVFVFKIGNIEALEGSALGADSVGYEMCSSDNGPSDRDIRIYVRHKIEGHSIRRCGAEFGLDPSRITRICQAIEPWVLRQLMAEHPDPQTQKLKITAKLDRVWQLASEGWRRTRKKREKFVAKSGGKFGDATERSLEAQSGDPAFLRVMLDVERARRELWGLDEPKRHRHAAVVQQVEEPTLTLEEQADEVIADLITEAERRGIVIDVEHAPAVDDADGQGEAAAGNGKSESLPPPGVDRREGPEPPA